MTLDDYLNKKELTDSDFAREIGLTRSENVRRWRNGDCIPRKTAIAKIFQATNGHVAAKDFYQTNQ